MPLWSYPRGVGIRALALAGIVAIVDRNLCRVLVLVKDRRLDGAFGLAASFSW